MEREHSHHGLSIDCRLLRKLKWLYLFAIQETLEVSLTALAEALRVYELSRLSSHLLSATLILCNESKLISKRTNLSESVSDLILLIVNFKIVIIFNLELLTHCVPSSFMQGTYKILN